MEEHAHRHERTHDHDGKKDEVAARNHFPRMAHEELQAGPLVRVAAAQQSWTRQQRKEAVPACPGLQVRIGHTLQRSGRLTDSKADSDSPVGGLWAVCFIPTCRRHSSAQATTLCGPLRSLQPAPMASDLCSRVGVFFGTEIRYPCDMIALSPGTVVGGEYVLDRAIGEGGMGAVFLARQRSTNRLRALKVLNAAVVADERSRERFAREAMAASLIDSEHVVEVIAAGIDEALGGVPWLAMEFLEGEELTDHVTRQPERRLPQSHVCVVLEQVFHAISAAHAAGVVHRDIKPQNVFLARSRLVGVPFVVKVLDFGIAKFVSETAPQSRTSSLGTPGWMAPEQVERGLATPAADVWALVVLVVLVARSAAGIRGNPTGGPNGSSSRGRLRPGRRERARWWHRDGPDRGNGRAMASLCECGGL